MPSRAQDTKAAAERTRMSRVLRIIAKGLSDPDCVILIGTIPSQHTKADPEGTVAFAEPFSNVLLSLALERTYVQEVIKSPQDVPPIIYVQWNSPGTAFGNDYVAPDFLPRGKAKLMLLSRAQKICTHAPLVGIRGSKVQEFITQNKAKMSVPEMMQAIGAEPFINVHTWYEAYQNQGVIDTDLPEMETIPQKQLSAKERVIQARRVPPSYVLPAEFLPDLKTLAKHPHGSVIPETSAGKLLKEQLESVAKEAQ